MHSVYIRQMKLLCIVFKQGMERKMKVLCIVFKQGMERCFAQCLNKADDGVVHSS